MMQMDTHQDCGYITNHIKAEHSLGTMLSSYVHTCTLHQLHTKLPQSRESALPYWPWVWGRSTRLVVPVHRVLLRVTPETVVCRVPAACHWFRRRAGGNWRPQTASRGKAGGGFGHQLIYVRACVCVEVCVWRWRERTNVIYQ